MVTSVTMAYMNYAFSTVNYVCLAISHKLVMIFFANSLQGATNDFIGNLFDLIVHLGALSLINRLLIRVLDSAPIPLKGKLELLILGMPYKPLMKKGGRVRV